MMITTSTIPQTLLTRRQAAESMSLSERTVSAIPPDLLPIVRIGRAVRYRIVDIESLTSRLALGKVTIGKVNG